MAPLPHEDREGEEEEEVVVPDPQELVDRARALTLSADDIAARLLSLASTQKAHTKSIGQLGEVLSRPTSRSTGLPERVSTVLAKMEAQTAQSEQILVDVHAALQSKKIKEFSAQSEAFKSAKQVQAAAQKKLDAQSNVKGKKAALVKANKEEDEARKKAEASAKSAVAAAKSAEREHTTTLHLAVRDAAFSQLALHARGLELFTELMTELSRWEPKFAAE